MKTLLLLLLTSTVLIATECKDHLKYGVPSKADKILCKEAFAIGYSYKHKSPLWASYKLTKKLIDGNISRKGKNFVPDSDINLDLQASNSDYENNPYDKGHVVPAASINYTKNALDESFLYTNCFLQQEGLNRYGWSHIEQLVRDIISNSKEQEGYVITGAVYSDKSARYEISSIPIGFYKSIFLPKTKTIHSWFVPNVRLLKKSAINSFVSVDTIEAFAKVDLYSKLPNSIENKLEKIIQIYTE